MAVVLYMTRVADAGVDLGLGVREVAAGPEHLRRVAPSILSLRLLLAAAMVLVFGGLALAFLPAPDGQVLALYTLPLFAIAASTKWIHIGLEDTRLVAVARTIGEVLMLGLVLVFVQTADDLIRVPLAQFVGDAVAAGILLLALRRAGYPLSFELRGDVIRPLARRALPLVASALLGLLIYNADLIFLRFLRGRADVGYYAAAYSLIAFLINLGIAYSLSLLPTLTRLTGDPEQRHALYHSAVAQVFAVSLPIAVGGFFVAPGIIDIVFGKEFGPSGAALAILLISVPLSLVRDVPIIALMSDGEEPLVLRVTGAAALVNLVLNAVLIPPFGIHGAAAATTVTEGIRLIVAVWLARKIGFPWAPVARFWRASAAAAVMGLAVFLVADRPLYVSIAVGVAAYTVALLVVGGIRVRRGGLPVLSV
jgi:O-antigen/teichoic acid export membrane protein